MQEHLFPMVPGDDKHEIAPRFDASVPVTLYCGDCLALLADIAAAGSTAQLVITSPPYNTGKEYEDQVSLEAYIEGQKQVIEAAVRILGPEGSICWQVGHFIQDSGRDKEAFPLDLVLYPIFKDLGLKLRNRIVWHFAHGLHEKYRFSGRHETILWFTRNSNEYTFNLDAVRVPQKYPGKRAFRGPRKGLPSGNPLGKNPGDVWDMPNVKANHVEKTIHPCQFPVALAERLVLALTNRGDLVVDPYMGVGSTAVACVRNGRRVAGADIEKRYLDVAVERIQAAWEGTLPIRPLNKPVYEPASGMSLTQIPKEWAEESSRLLDDPGEYDSQQK